MHRMKTDLELHENPHELELRLRYALLVISTARTLKIAKATALAAMRGEKHGYEIPTNPAIQ